MKILITGLISCMGLSALAQALPGNETDRADRRTYACPHERTTKEDNGHVWVCSADNIYVKGFMGQSTNKHYAMHEAVTKCEASSQLAFLAVLRVWSSLRRKHWCSLPSSASTG